MDGLLAGHRGRRRSGLSVRLALGAFLLSAAVASAADVPRPEHPRPDRMRAEWQTLNGPWEFDFDEADRGLAEGWFRGARGLSRSILVPYCPESRLSGIGDTSPHEVVWYRRRFTVPEAWKARRRWLHFGAVDYSQVVIDARMSRPAPDLRLRATVALDGATVAQSETRVADRDANVTLRLPGQRLWSPEHPTLYDLTLEAVAGGKVLDTLQSYFGQRKVSTHAGKVYLNDAPYYLRLVLDPGHSPESVLTPPTDDAIQRDIQLAKSFGLNGARKHQKVEDPRWLYWCDKMGFLAWGEMANAYEYSDVYVSRMLEEWPQAIARDYNHPSIITWVPINESWGVPGVLTDRAQQAHLKSLYELTRSLDSTRLVVDNDGWEHTDATDLMTLHDYARTGAEIAAKYQGLGEPGHPIPRNGREALVYGAAYNGTPFLMTEFGGIAFRLGAPGAANEWGYSGIEPTAEAFLTRLEGLVKAIEANPAFAGYCYTQLTNVEQEINGLATFDRKPKVDPAQIKRVMGPGR